MDILFTHAAHNGNNIAGSVIHNHHGRLQLLRASGFGNLAQVRINPIHRVLHIHIQAGVDVIAAAGNEPLIGLHGFFIDFHAVPRHQRPGHILIDRIHIPGVNFLGGIDANGDFLTAGRAEIIIPLSAQRADDALIATGFVRTIGHLVFLGNTVFKNKFLRHGFIVLFFRNETLQLHLLQRIQLAFPVSLGTVHAVGIQLLTVGIIQ